MRPCVIICEKPSVAKSIASVLGANSKQDGYFEGNGYFVTYAFGHLFTLADTKDYLKDYVGWDLSHYPFIPEQFIYKPIDDPGVKKQINIISNLIKESDTIICATDADREGELIFAEIKNSLRIHKPIKRLWITSHTPKDIERGINDLKDEMLNLEKAGYCRQQIDWIIGINLTVVYTLKTGGAYTLKVGRVILPTLNLIFERDTEIANFRAESFYTLKVLFTATKGCYSGTYIDKENNSRFPVKDQLEVIKNTVFNQCGVVTKKESNHMKEYSPRLFNLTDLQGYITNKFKGFSSEKVLDIAQTLYEKRYISYPRTASRHLDNSQASDAEDALKAVINIPELNLLNSAAEVVFHTDKRVFDSTKVDSHPAIIPTYIAPDVDKLPEDEKIVYIEVVKRFIAQFMPAAVYDTLEIITKVKDYDFITKGKVLISEGWKLLYLSGQDQINDQDIAQDDEVEDKITTYGLNQGDSFLASGAELKEGKTKPPQHYTEKTLLSAMENCGKKVENLDDVLKGFTIGTPATRADTIMKLIESGYVQRKGKYLLITELGARVILNFPVKNLLKVEFTGKIEKTLKDIENEQYDPKAFMEKMAAFITKNVEAMKNSDIPVIPKNKNVLGVCPDCKNYNVIETPKAFSCEGTKYKKCSFTIWKESKFLNSLGKNMTETIAKSLVKNQEAPLKGIRSKKDSNKKYDAILCMTKNSETGSWSYSLKFPDKKPNTVNIKHYN